MINRIIEFSVKNKFFVYLFTWAFEYALIDRTGKHDLSQLRTVQDWYVRYWLASVPGVSEVASIGGFVKQYQVTINPKDLLAYKIPINDVIGKIRMSNNDVGGRVVEMSGREYMVRGLGYIKNIEDIEGVAIGNNGNGTPVYLRDIANVQLGPDIRRGFSDLNGEGDVVGGIVVVRFGENALAVIERVKERIASVRSSLPEGVELVPVYDRSELILESVKTLKEKLIEETLIVSLVCIVFLFHFRSALVAIVTLPVAILMSVVSMYYIGLNSNIMSLGGIAIAIGAMVDAAIIMIENAHKHLENWAEAGSIGKLKLRGEIAQKQADTTGRLYEATRLNVINELKMAYFELYRAEKSIDTVEKNRELLTQLAEIARARYEVGSGLQQDVFKAQLETTMLEERLTMFQQKRDSMKARINQLRHEPPDAPLGSVGEIQPSELRYSLEQLYATAEEANPILGSRRTMVDRDARKLDLAKKQYLPDFSLRVGYM
jgi:hypothetical protein